jgi:hypothetical protein
MNESSLEETIRRLLQKVAMLELERDTLKLEIERLNTYLWNQTNEPSFFRKG